MTFTEGSSKAELHIPIIDDDILEPDETFTAIVIIPDSADGVEAGDDSEATVTIANDDEEIVVSLDPEDYTVNENDGFAVITVKASKPSSEKYTVMINTQDGTATGEWMYNHYVYGCFNVCVVVVCIVHAHNHEILSTLFILSSQPHRNWRLCCWTVSSYVCTW